MEIIFAVVYVTSLIAGILVLTRTAIAIVFGSQANASRQHPVEQDPVEYDAELKLVAAMSHTLLGFVLMVLAAVIHELFPVHSAREALVSNLPRVTDAYSVSDVTIAVFFVLLLLIALSFAESDFLKLQARSRADKEKGVSVLEIISLDQLDRAMPFDPFAKWVRYFGMIALISCRAQFTTPSTALYRATSFGFVTLTSSLATSIAWIMMLIPQELLTAIARLKSDSAAWWVIAVILAVFALMTLAVVCYVTALLIGRWFHLTLSHPYWSWLSYVLLALIWLSLPLFFQARKDIPIPLQMGLYWITINHIVVLGLRLDGSIRHAKLILSSSAHKEDSILFR